MINIFNFQTTAYGLLFVLLLIVNNSEEAIIKSLDLNTVKNSETKRENLMAAIETKVASEILGITDPNLARVSDLTEFLLSIVANVLVIWGFGQEQDSYKQEKITNQNKETETTQLFSKWKPNLDGLNSRMEDVKRSLQELNCRLDSPQVIKNKGVVSQECLQFVQPLVSPSTRNLLPKQTAFLKKRNFALTS